jgi:hypothetical protein
MDTFFIVDISIWEKRPFDNGLFCFYKFSKKSFPLSSVIQKLGKSFLIVILMNRLHTQFLKNQLPLK